MMTYVLFLCILVGIYSGMLQIYKTRNNIIPGVKPSNNLFTFLFIDPW